MEYTTVVSLDMTKHTYCVIILDIHNVLSENSYKNLRDDMQSRHDFIEGDANDVRFPGKIAIVDRLIVDPMIDAILTSKEVHAHFPKEIFEQRDGFSLTN